LLQCSTIFRCYGAQSFLLQKELIFFDATALSHFSLL
jgi:hypothetical protein